MKLQRNTNHIEINDTEEESDIHFGIDDSHKFNENSSINRESDLEKEIIVEYVEQEIEYYSGDVTDSDEEGGRTVLGYNPSKNVPYDFGQKVMLGEKGENK